MIAPPLFDSVLSDRLTRGRIAAPSPFLSKIQSRPFVWLLTILRTEPTRKLIHEVLADELNVVVRSHHGTFFDGLVIYGMGGNDKVIWVVAGSLDPPTFTIYDVDPTTFVIRREAPVPFPAGFGRPYDIGGDGTVIWYSHFRVPGTRVYKIDATNFRTLRSRDFSFSMEGIGGDATTVWASRVGSSPRIYELSSGDLSIVRSVPSPGGANFPAIGGSHDRIYGINSGEQRLVTFHPRDLTIAREWTVNDRIISAIGGL